ncbi:MAG: thioredoxin family protein [Bdellovibrionota bacterium]|nr:thioredoxin family protein [Bdellovibrionota bacterium]
MECLTVENFEQVVNQEKGLFIIKFSSPTCGPCKSMAPVLKKLEQNNSGVNFYEIDTMQSPELAAHFNVRGVPYIAFCENREVIYDFTGLTPIGSLQYVINNINDAYFREYGEFKTEEKAKNYWFELTLAFIVLIFILALFLL